MSEDKRKLARTQGRFAGGDDGKPYLKKSGVQKAHSSSKEHHHWDRDAEHSRYDKVPPRHRKKSNERSSRKGESQSASHVRSKPGHTLEYAENEEQCIFEKLDKKSEPITITDSGSHVLGKTENGESKIFYNPSFILFNESYPLFDKLMKEIVWHEKNIVIRGEEFSQPRQVAWFGPLPYTYSGATFPAKEIPDMIMEVKRKVEEEMKSHGIDVEFNAVLANLYRNNHDSVGWHCDDEPLMGIRPTIGSVSLGEVRRFEMRRKPTEYGTNDPPEYVVHLKHGSLIVMDGAMQLDWQHRVPKEYHDKKPRINLTFRTVYELKNNSDEDLSTVKHEIKNTGSPQEAFQYREENFPSLGNTTPERHMKVEPIVRNSNALNQLNNEVKEKPGTQVSDSSHQMNINLDEPGVHDKANLYQLTKVKEEPSFQNNDPTVDQASNTVEKEMNIQNIASLCQPSYKVKDEPVIQDSDSSHEQSSKAKKGPDVQYSDSLYQNAREESSISASGEQLATDLFQQRYQKKQNPQENWGEVMDRNSMTSDIKEKEQERFSGASETSSETWHNKKKDAWKHEGNIELDIQSENNDSQRSSRNEGIHQYHHHHSSNANQSNRWHNERRPTNKDYASGENSMFHGKDMYFKSEIFKDTDNRKSVKEHRYNEARSSRKEVRPDSSSSSCAIYRNSTYKESISTPQDGRDNMERERLCRACNEVKNNMECKDECFHPRDVDELNVLLEISKHWESLPLQVICVLDNRVEFLNRKCMRKEGQMPRFSQPNQSKRGQFRGGREYGRGFGNQQFGHERSNQNSYKI